MMPSWAAQSRGRRQRQIGGLIQRELSDLLERELRDPGLGFAREYISVMGDEEERQSTMAALGRAGGFIRHELAARLKLRYMPQIEFVSDLTLERAARVQELLDQALTNSVKPTHEGTPAGSEDESQG